MKNLPNKFTLAIMLVTLIPVMWLTGATIMADPTRPPDALLPEGKKLKVRGSLEVSAIFIYPDRRFAIINGQSAMIGDQIGEYTIINIQHDTVELKGSENNSMVLPLLPTVKQRPDKGR